MARLISFRVEGYNYACATFLLSDARELCTSYSLDKLSRKKKAKYYVEYFSTIFKYSNSNTLERGLKRKGDK